MMPGVDGNGPKRFSVQRKMAIVARLLRGEPLELVARERDWLHGEGGGDTMIGGAGDDLYDVDSASDLVTENLDEGHDGVFALLDYSLGPNIEYVQLTGYGNLNAVGNDLNNSLRGNSGSNTLIGGLGDDTLDGGDDIYNGMEQS